MPVERVESLVWDGASEDVGTVTVWDGASEQAVDSLWVVVAWDIEETFDARPLGTVTASNGMSQTFNCEVTDTNPLAGTQSMVTPADGSFGQVTYLTGGSFTCEFIAKKVAGTQTNHAMIWSADLSAVLRADLQFRNDASGQLWLRYNYGAPGSGKSSKTFAVGEVFRVQIRFVPGVSLEADLWYGANLYGVAPDETLNVNSVPDVATDLPLEDISIGNIQTSGLQFMVDDIAVAVGVSG